MGQRLEIDSSENDKQGGGGTWHKSGSQGSADSSDDLSVRNNNSIIQINTIKVRKRQV